MEGFHNSTHRFNYPWANIVGWKMAFPIGKPSRNGELSIARLAYQRVFLLPLEAIPSNDHDPTFFAFTNDLDGNRKDKWWQKSGITPDPKLV